ncbi:hypothetical protein, partial [Mesorhizobium sp.]|uniref:hypothetical protein n=1 Tax=Mesorhizobium sp. TaxID=1871066 RepID=UPI0025D5FD9A
RKQLRDRLHQLVQNTRVAPPADPPAIIDPTVERVKPGSITAWVRHLRNSQSYGMVPCRASAKTEPKAAFRLLSP